MAESAALQADLRETPGKGAARAARRNGKIPGIVYGSGQDNVMIELDRDVMNREVSKPGFYNHLYELKVGGKTINVLPRELQVHPVTDAVLHVDFLAVKADATVTVNVPVVFLNEEDCPGIVRGGVLNVVRHEIEVNCPANAIPEQIDIDLAGLDIGDSVHISMVNLANNVAPTIDDRDFTIATIAAPTIITEEEEAEGEEGEEGVAAEGEEGEAEGEEGEAEGGEDED
jgi:large subunit ribosomal protein L25